MKIKKILKSIFKLYIFLPVIIVVITIVGVLLEALFSADLKQLLNVIAIVTIIALIVGVKQIISMYNDIIKKENRADNAYGTIQAYLKRRHDLIPNLVSSVKKYMEYESTILEKIVALRNSAKSEDLSKSKKAKLESDMTQALDSLIVQVEGYPELKANENFTKLLNALNEIEEQLSASRRFYNSSVKRYNDSIEIFPANILANMFNFEQRQMFEAEVHEHKTPDINAMLENQNSS